MKNILFIKADINDGDYITMRHEVTDSELKALKPIIKAIAAQKKKNYYMSNWGNNEYADKPPEVVYKGILTEEQISLFNDYLSSFEGRECHSIASIELFKCKPSKLL